jgi:type II secretory pathway component PulC
MKRVLVISIMCALVFMTSGCKIAQKCLLKIKPVSAQEKPGSAIKKVESVDLAESILKPRPYQFTLPRDPFKPLFGKLSLLSPQEERDQEKPPQFKVMGILIKEGAPLALLEVPSEGTLLLREGGKIGKYTVKKIEPKQVIFEKGDKSFILQIGEEK